jgi:TolB-like protein/tetratricopeptide (TPR) repeat protein
VVPPVTEPSHAVFLSYASQDAEAAQRICEALRAAGIEVWFDQSALRGGDVWDQTIRKQIKTCVLFIPVISRHTHERDEGYFRLEWKLAVDRSHLMTTNKAFLLPVVVDDTREDDENVPDRFRDIHWTRLPGGETPPAFVERVRRLVSPEPSHGPTTTALPAAPGSAATPLTRERVATPWRSKQALPMVLAVVVAGALAYFGINKFWFSNYQASPPTPPAARASAAPAAFSPPPHSIAVLPFVNMSGDKEQEYFSEGLTEELLNSLSRIDGLQVAARTSSFSFQGEHPDIATVAHKLNVGAVLEGSVRRSAHTVRIHTQLVNAVTGFHVWSQTYDRDLGDVLRLQMEIATTVANALKVPLLKDETAKIEVGGTRNPEAFDAYLRASKAYFNAKHAKDTQAAVDGYTDAIRLDPDYALAYAARSHGLFLIAFNWANTESAIRVSLEKARSDAQRAIALSPDLDEGHIALGQVYESAFELTRASEEYERALALGPGNARVLRGYGTFASLMGHEDSALTALHRSLALDPLNPSSQWALGWGLTKLRRYREAIAAFQEFRTFKPDDPGASGFIGLNYYLHGDFQRARLFCENKSDEEISQMCLAMTYEKLGRHADAEAALTKMHNSTTGGSRPLFLASIYAQWGSTDRALESLDSAMRMHDPGLELLKTDPLMDPLRKEPRFQAVMRELKFPS